MKDIHEQKFLLPRTVSLKDRIRTEEEKKLFEHLNEEKAIAENELFRRFPDPTNARWSEVQDFIREHLAYLAGASRAFSWQYREFRVGAALLGFRAAGGGESPWRIMFNANTKDEAHGVARCCAEQYLFDDLKAEGIQKILSLAIVGEAQDDEHSEREQITLTPCISCRESINHLMSEKAGIIDADTEIFTVRSDNVGFTQLFRAKDLHHKHRPVTRIPH